MSATRTRKSERSAQLLLLLSLFERTTIMMMMRRITQSRSSSSSSSRGDAARNACCATQLMVRLVVVVVVAIACYSCCSCSTTTTTAIQIPRVPAQRFVTLARTRARYTTPVRLRQALPLMEEKSSSSSSSSININGDHPLATFDGMIDGAVATEAVVLIAEDSPETASPPISYGKFLTMQEKRAVVTIRYSGDAGLKPYFLTMAKKLKQSHPDIIIERRILPAVADNGEATFEVLVDNKVVIGRRKVARSGNSVAMQQSGARRSVFVSMGELDLAISRARRKHRPTTAYGDEGEPKKTKR